MLVVQIFAWLSYIIICLAACIIIHDFLEQKLPQWKRKKHEDTHPQP